MFSHDNQVDTNALMGCHEQPQGAKGLRVECGVVLLVAHLFLHLAQFISKFGE